jgi:hypothetical protein
MVKEEWSKPRSEKRCTDQRLVKLGRKEEKDGKSEGRGPLYTWAACFSSSAHMATLFLYRLETGRI